MTVGLVLYPESSNPHGSLPTVRHCPRGHPKLPVVGVKLHRAEEAASKVQLGGLVWVVMEEAPPAQVPAAPST